MAFRQSARAALRRGSIQALLIDPVRRVAERVELRVKRVTAKADAGEEYEINVSLSALRKLLGAREVAFKHYENGMVVAVSEWGADEPRPRDTPGFALTVVGGTGPIWAGRGIVFGWNVQDEDAYIAYASDAPEIDAPLWIDAERTEPGRLAARVLGAQVVACVFDTPENYMRAMFSSATNFQFTKMKYAVLAPYIYDVVNLSPPAASVDEAYSRTNLGLGSSRDVQSPLKDHKAFVKLAGAADEFWVPLDSHFVMVFE
jgi:hypothetical protein